MIVYGRGARIYETLFRIHGSALYKGILPAVISTAILLILVSTTVEPTYELDDRWFTHPYPISAMIAAFTFLLTFKCSFSYNRYWEACSSIFQMQSKWLDAGLQLAAWHLQSSRYSNIKPPSFGEHPELNSVLRKRKANRALSPHELREMLERNGGGNKKGATASVVVGGGLEKGDEDSIEDRDIEIVEEHDHGSTRIRHPIQDDKISLSFLKRTSTSSLLSRRNTSFWNRIGNRPQMNQSNRSSHAIAAAAAAENNRSRTTTAKKAAVTTGTRTTTAPEDVVQIGYEKSIHAQCSTRGSFPIITNNSATCQKATSTKSKSTTHRTINNTSDMERTPFNHKRNLSHIVSVANLDGGMEHDEYPSPFLQEASHLLSLLSAVAFTTLRNDLQRAPAPLCEYEVGSPWPPVDPDLDKSNNYYEMNSFLVAMNYLLGNVRTDAQRTVYNSCRPLKVLGGVSDAEIEMLQRARGPVAKTSLCILWMQEFISREFESGALGKTAPPIVSRVYQVLSDGTLGYNQARKVAYVPFPFPHTQLTTFYIVVITLFMPVLMLTFVSNTIAAAVTNFFTVGVFLGLWHVSTELEDPFRNVPNDLPLNNFQAQFNEALVVMFAGFHPEAWWDIGDNVEGISPFDILQPPSPPSSSSPSSSSVAAAAAASDANNKNSSTNHDES